jgi:beta-N-acetylhexosaminidase
MRFIFLALAILSNFSTLYADWVDDTLKQMSLDEKIGQLLIVASYPNQKEAQFEGQNEPRTEYVEEMISKYHVGGVLFKYYWDRPFGVSWDALSLASQVNHFQSLSNISLLTLQDCEWGLNHRHSNGMRFPKNMTLGAIQNESLIYEYGQELARQVKKVGIFCPNAPVVDVNTNPLNPIIGDRSFGDKPQDVARKGVLLMKGLQDAGVIACAKHFPGHGDTLQDTHTALAKISRNQKELENSELLPFQALIDNGVKCVMSAHILVPALENKNVPATLSKPIMTNLLQNKMRFNGVIITDDMLMKAIASNYAPGEACQLAFQAGCTMLLSSKDIPVSFEALKKLILEKQATEDELNERVRKILTLKKWLLDKNGTLSAQLDLQKNFKDIYTEKALELKRRLYEEAMTFINPKFLTKNSAMLQVGGLATNNLFTSKMTEEKKLPLFFLPPDATKRERKAVLKKLSSYDTILVSFCEMNRSAQENFGIKKESESLITELRKLNKNIIYVLFGSPYALKFFKKDESILVAYEDDKECEKASARILLQEIKAKGKLPITRP